MKSKKILSTILILVVMFTMTINLNTTKVYAADTAVDTWDALETAVGNAPAGTLYTIDVTSNLTANSNCFIGDGKNIVIQSSNGSTITRHSSLSEFSVFDINGTNTILTLKSITLKGDGTTTYSSPMIWVSAGGTFTMDTGAIIKDVTANVDNGAAGVNVAEGTLNIHDGAEITNVNNSSSTDCGSAIYLSVGATTTLNMDGGSIMDNKAGHGSIFVGVGCTANLSGSPTISSNTKSDGTTPCNVFLMNSPIKLNSTFTPTAKIGITTSVAPSAGSPVSITAASDQDWSSKFASDSTSYIIQNSGSGSSQVVQLAVKSVNFSSEVTVNKDSSVWKDGTPSIKLSTSDTSLTEEVTGSVLDGVYTFTGLDASKTYYVWDATDNQYTGKSVTNANKNAVVDYYSVQFAVTDTGTANGSTISAEYNSSAIDSGKIVLGGKQLVITAVGQGSSNYRYLWTGAGTSNETTGALTISPLSGAVNATCHVSSTAPRIITTSLSNGTVGTAYSQNVSVLTTALITWSITEGSLPAGLSLNTSTGAITGTPTATGTSNFKVKVSNANGSDTKAYTVTISASPATYALSITAGSGGTVSSAGGTYAEGAIVNITATPNSNYSFSGWTTSNDGSFADASSTSTTFTMPANSTTITAAFTYSGHAVPTPAAPTPAPPVQPTVTGHVVDDATGNQISKFAAAVTAGSNGTYTVTMDEASALQINKPDGTKGAVADTSKIIIEASKTSAVSFSTSADGKIQLQGLGKGTECSFDVTCDLGNGQKIDIGKMEIKVDNDGNINIVNRLIDPFGKITDAYTQKPVTGVGLTLYYADTARNTANGKKPGTIVSLPNIEGFKPNNNSNPQTSDANGAFGFMVFPESDYYIVAVKDGYDKYVSPTISVEKKIVKWDFKMNKSNQINGLNRLPGENRIDTDLNIVKATFSGKVSNVILATADNYPDALAGSVLAYNLNAPILLVGRSDASQEKIFSYIKNNMDAGGTVYILGGNGAVSEQVENKLKSNGNNIIRIGGADRYETSAKIAKQLAVETGTPVVLVSGQDYPDALSVSSIAAANGYPVLLVNKDGISDAVKQELMNINPERVYIIGLQGAVGKTVENEIPGVVGINSSSVIRIGGQDRFRTSAAVAKYFKLITSSVCIATGNDFPDALAGCVYAAKYNAPIILVNKTISEDAMAYFKSNNLYGINIFGGEGAVNKNIENQLSQILKH